MLQKKPKLFFILAIVALIFCDNIFANCLLNPKLQRFRSLELQRILNADQKDREFNLADLYKNNKWRKLMMMDLVRRKRVGEIFGEGCIISSKDYLAAAMVYQHGDIPDHFYQAYIWAKRAIELGDKEGKHMVSLAIDRYLNNTGRKQLFGTQAKIIDISKGKTCFCMTEVELSFSDALRKEYIGFTLKEKIDDYMREMVGQKYCPEKCIGKLKPTPKGSVPGLW